MSVDLLRDVVEAVLYEGYVLYPYRPSSKKNNRERFTFGRVYPKPYSVAQEGVEPFVMQTQCLLSVKADSPVLNVSIGFLHPMSREIAVLRTPLGKWTGGLPAGMTVVPELRVGDQIFQSWHEQVERKVRVPTIALGNDATAPAPVSFRFFESHELEPIREERMMIVGMIMRRQETVEGTVEVSVEPLSPDLHKVTVRVFNETPVAENEMVGGESVLMRTFASTHMILSAEGAEFISLLDPPDALKAAVDDCKNIGVWPVLVGDENRQERNAMLSSPIILYDYPKIAPESAGTLFDGLEIDEILTLRLLTMTDEEKREMRAVDEHARRLLERTENLSEDSLLKMHGVMRRPETAAIDFDDFFGASTPLQRVTVEGVALQAGDRVRLRPKARADVMDIALNGQTAVIEAIEQDMEKRVHLAVVLENDPGKDLGLLRQPGHRFFYGLDEVEPLKEVAR